MSESLISVELVNGAHIFKGKDVTEATRALVRQLMFDFNISFDMAYIHLEAWINSTIIPTVAMSDLISKGSLRAAFFNAWERNRSVKLNDPLGSYWELKFNSTKFKDSPAYAIKHILQIWGSATYKDPTIAGTKPIDIATIWNQAINRFVNHFAEQMQFRGYNF